MSNPFYTSSSSAADGTVIDEDDVNNQFSAIEAAFDAVYDVVKRAIKTSVGEATDQVLADATARINTLLMFDSSGDAVATSSWIFNQDAGGYRLTNLGNPSGAQDAVTLSFMTTAIAATAGISPSGGPGFLYSDGSILSWASQYPSQTGNDGKVLETDGTSASWQLKYPAQSGSVGMFLTTDGTDVSWGEVFNNASTTFGASHATATVATGGASTTTARNDYRSASGAQAYDVRVEITGGTSGTAGKGKRKTIARIDTFTGVFGADATHALGNLGAAETIDWDNGGHQSGTLDQNCTITVPAPASGFPVGPCYKLYLTEGGAGAFTMTWAGATITWAGGVSPPAQAAGTIIGVYLDWNGSKFLGSWVAY